MVGISGVEPARIHLIRVALTTGEHYPEVLFTGAMHHYTKYGVEPILSLINTCAWNRTKILPLSGCRSQLAPQVLPLTRCGEPICPTNRDHTARSINYAEFYKATDVGTY